jgi:hypothetical protein
MLEKVSVNILHLNGNNCSRYSFISPKIMDFFKIIFTEFMMRFQEFFCFIN